MTQLITTEKLASLLGHIEDNTGERENECSQILRDFAYILVPFDNGYSYTSAEVNTDTGRLDLVVVAKKTNQAGLDETTVFIWEYKSPQKFICLKETQSRVRPSNDFFQAENQLLHYVHSSQSQSFKEKYRAKNVEFGGIIIGRKDKVCNSSEEADVNMAIRCLELREKMLYKTPGMRIYTWTQIYDLLKKSHRGEVSLSFSADGKDTINANDIPSGSALGFAPSELEE